MSGLEAEVEVALAAAGVAPGDAVGIACSGGPDSVVLAEIVVALARRAVVGSVHLIHVDHGLREDSADDAARVRDLGLRLGVPVHVRCAAVDTQRSSLEAAARDARYAALDAVADAEDLRWILLGHTASDQAETVLMRVIRGTGVAGLAGIPARRSRYLRPLLAIDRQRVEGERADRDLPASYDPMNRDMRFFRCRVRHHWLPALAAENPQIEASLARLATAAREQREVLDWAARALLAQASRRDGGLATDILRAAPPAIAKRALTLAAEAMGVSLEAVHLEAAQRLLDQASGSVVLDAPGLRLVREYDQLRLHARHLAPATESPALEIVAGTGGPFEIRRWRPGDRMRPARLQGRSRKLSDLFVDLKVPRERRKEARVVVTAADGAIVWAEHIGAAHGADIEVARGPTAGKN